MLDYIFNLTFCQTVTRARGEIYWHMIANHLASSLVSEPFNEFSFNAWMLIISSISIFKTFTFILSDCVVVRYEFYHFT